jgi:uncharacterized protein
LKFPARPRRSGTGRGSGRRRGRWAQAPLRVWLGTHGHSSRDAVCDAKLLVSRRRRNLTDEETTTNASLSTCLFRRADFRAAFTTRVYRVRDASRATHVIATRTRRVDPHRAAGGGAYQDESLCTGTHVPCRTRACRALLRHGGAPASQLRTNSNSARQGTPRHGRADWPRCAHTYA